MTIKELKTKLTANGVKRRVNSKGLLHFYIRTSHPKRMPDGSFWNGTETIGDYYEWEDAIICPNLATYAGTRTPGREVNFKPFRAPKEPEL